MFLWVCCDYGTWLSLVLTMTKPPLGIIPRHFWYKNRVKDCIDALKRIEETEDWGLYLKQSLKFANEIKYACEQWEKFYYE